ncbi:hypothetical protein SNE40_022591 [Patella caerulea]|uniref:E3 ubiquitin-protein ligase n=1 Tax=Patella caerulea TaxID=87958 RepID=A0AAN8G8I9_PATCE
MATSDTPNALLKRSKRSVATHFRGEFSRHHNSQKLNEFLDTILDPTEKLDDSDKVEWCRCLIAGGSTFEEFSKTVRQFDNAVTCGLVWTSNFVAYRCRTCGISPCMSLCSECFQAGNHEGHDFNMFKSHAGGACDCGDVNVMNADGFCPRHGPGRRTNTVNPPPDLLSIAEIMLPKLMMRLVYHLRCYINNSSNQRATFLTMYECEKFVGFLHSLADMGAAMRSVIAKALTNTEVYENLTKVGTKDEGGRSHYYTESQKCYQTILTLSMYPQGFERFQNKPGLNQKIVHQSLLEELVFWIVKYDFPTNINTLLLKMLPEDDYKIAFAKAYVQHYSRTALVLCTTRERVIVANRVVHISVQLFSNESLAFKMADEYNLLYTIVICLTHMLENHTIPSTLEDATGEPNFHQVVDCSNEIMKDHCYWSIVTDFINLLSHRRITLKFLEDEELVTLWVEMLSYLQGMNLNQREVNQHVEFEPDTYYAAFSAELEISALPMWSILQHCKTPETSSLTLRMIAACQTALQDWFDAINITENSKPNPNQLTFHLPLHRYLATFMMQAVQYQGIELTAILPDEDMLKKILVHVLQTQVCMSQIFAGMWVRNGIQIRGQAMTYVQCHFCYSMSDADLHLTQVCASKLDPDYFVRTVLERFNVLDWLSFSSTTNVNNIKLTADQQVSMVEGVLAYFTALLSIRTYLGISEQALIREEMVALLCMSDQQHSQLLDLMPEKSGNSSRNKELFEPTLKQIADFKAPNFEAGGGMQQGTYVPKGFLWETEYDPVKVVQRAVYKKDVQSALDRYTQHIKKNCNYKEKGSPWPPYRMPADIHHSYKGLFKILNCKTMHAFLYIVLYKAVKCDTNLPDSILYHCIHLLSMAFHFAPRKSTVRKTRVGAGTVSDCQLKDWFSNSDIRHNVCDVIDEVIIHTDNTGDIETEESCTMNVDMDSNSLVEMFDLATSNIVVESAGPMTSAKVGQKPIITMISKPGSVSNSSFTSTSHSSGAKPKYESHTVPTEQSHAPSVAFKMEESMISLLIKLHSKLAGKQNSYIPITVKKREPVTSCIGDGLHFISRLLDSIANTNSECAAVVKQVYTACKPKDTKDNQSQGKNDESEAKSRETRRRKAAARQEKLMAEFASKQKAFMEQAMEGEDDGVDDGVKDEGMDVTADEGYDCVICSQCTASTAERPVGLVVFFQASSVLGHCPKVEVETPVSIIEKRYPRLSNRAMVQRRRLDELCKDLNEASCQMSVNIGWEGGVIVQTCGHFLHLDCHSSYIKSLKSQENTDNLAVKKGEYWCPLCRQLSNSVIPMVPEENKHVLVKPISHDPKQMMADLAEMMVTRPITPGSEGLTRAMGSVMEDLLHTTYPRFRSLSSMTGADSVYLLFVCSVARSNLELQLLGLGGQLNQQQVQNISNKNSFLPLLHVLSLHSKLITLAPTPYTDLWTHITGINLTEESSSITLYQKDVPLLLKDITSLLIQFILTLPFTIKEEHYTFVVQMLYNALYVQALTVIICKFGVEEREAWRKKGRHATVETLEGMLSHLITRLNCSRLFEQEEMDHSFPAICQSVWSPQSVAMSLQEHILPFIRIAVLLKLHLFKTTLPENQKGSEYLYLCKILNLSSKEASPQTEATSSSFVKWATTEPLQLTRAWCVDFMNYANLNPDRGRSLLMVNQTWYRPRLMSLPTQYYKIFQHYRNQTCSTCTGTPKDPSICLVCGEFLCFREQCCKQNSVFECVQHSISCGAGTGMFLLVNSSIIVVIRGARATLWGSVYLDEHGEEDRELKRGKPLYLSKERYNLLEQQWINHNFDHVCKKWIWHKDRL